MPIPTLPDPPTRADPASFNDRADAFLAALPAFVGAANTLEQSLQLVATTGTSASNMTVSAGAKTLVSQAGKAWVAGGFLLVCAALAPANYMVCQISSYDAGTGQLTVDAQGVFGAGAHVAWLISLSAPYIQPVDLGLTLQEWINATYAVGDYIHTDGTDPNARYPWQTWALIGAGQTLVNIDSGDATMDAVGETLGEKTHTLTTDEIPPLDYRDRYFAEAASTVAGITNQEATPGGTPVGGSNGGADTDNTRFLYLDRQTSGGGQAHNNMQPSRVTRIWCRTA